MEVYLRKISGITRRDIFDLFINGINQDFFWGEEKIYYPYYGRLEIVDFLKRLYPLEKWESQDSRADNAEEEITMHTRNGDYQEDWIFDDERFQLFDLDDNILLNFLCEVFHPEVRDEKKEWKKYFEKINNLLHEDGYDLVATTKISGRDVFSWRLYKKNKDMYIPFSERNKSLITSKKISIKLPNAVRHQLFKVMDEYNETFMFTFETNFNYYKSINELVLEDIIKFYIPKHYLGSELVEIKEFGDFKEGTSPFVVFDVIESFNRHVANEEFEIKINTIFKLNKIKVELVDGEIRTAIDKSLLLDSSITFNEIGVEELIKIAEDLYGQGKYSYAVEKIWDAFERIKTYYYPQLDKKKSVDKIIDEISCNNMEFRSMFASEFKSLTDIGNSYRIRHHETNKIDISEDIHYEYFYKRCFALISVLLKII